ncbi:MAG: hypothetical protein NTW14_14240 [bacterium]|nr:hypothetical protein [bacterium]
MKLNRLNIILTGFFICLAALAPNGWAQNRMIWNPIKPDKAATAAQVMVIGKRLTYYPLDKDSDITLSISGPTQLRVISRIDFSNQTGGEKSYYLRYEREDGEKKAFRRVATNSERVVLAENTANHLSNSRILLVDVPQGNHTYRFFVGEKATYRLYMRFYTPTAVVEKDSSTVAYVPEKYTTAVPLVINKKPTTYYRLGDQDSLKLTVIGPAQITVLARLEFDNPMLTAKKFRIRVLEDNQEKKTFSLKSWASTTAEYRDKNTKVVGKAARFIIDVPRGKHEYRFQIPNNGHSVLLRFYIPRKALQNNL